MVFTWGKIIARPWSIFLACLVLKGLTPSASAALIKETVEYKQGDAALEGYLVYDDALNGKRPGIMVVHEWKGLNDYAKRRADMLAQLGYVAFAADIYGKGIRPQTFADAGAMAGKFKADRALLRARVNVGLDVLKSLPDVDVSQLAAIGYCFGGTAVLELARSGAEIKGIVSFHGGLSSPSPTDARNIKAKVLVLHGAADPFVKAEEVSAFEKEMADAKVNYRLIKYPGAMHGFTNPDNKGDPPGALYNEAADKASWIEMQKFFKDIFITNLAASSR
ncbi:MAG: dienelactone hydrolase family protein [Candidatus Omnitrophica bacterium]|nr:dienelactone hydrolase family protein [Candidatus Omnitrophota bacterium]